MGAQIVNGFRHGRETMNKILTATHGVQIYQTLRIASMAAVPVYLKDGLLSSASLNIRLKSNSGDIGPVGNN
jgi:hypothetical protein